MEEEIKVNGNFAVKVGNMWAKQEYGDPVSLTDQPDKLMGFKKAYELSKKVGGRISMFKPQEIGESELNNLALAAGIGNKEEE